MLMLILLLLQIISASDIINAYKGRNDVNIKNNAKTETTIKIKEIKD